MSFEPANSRGDLRFLLTSRELADGRREIVLHLYRGEDLASKRTIAVVAEGVAETVLSASRAHFQNVGMKEHLPRLPRAANLDRIGRAA